MKSKTVQTVPRKIGTDLKRIFVRGMPDTETIQEFFNQPDDMYSAPVELILVVCNTLCIDVTSKYDRYAHTVLTLHHMILTERLNLPEVKSKYNFKKLDPQVQTALDTNNIYWRTPFIDYAPRLSNVIFCCRASDFDLALEKFQLFCLAINDRDDPNPLLSSRRFKQQRDSLNKISMTLYGFQFTLESYQNIEIFYVHLVKDLIT